MIAACILIIMGIFVPLPRAMSMTPTRLSRFGGMRCASEATKSLRMSSVAERDSIWEKEMSHNVELFRKKAREIPVPSKEAMQSEVEYLTEQGIFNCTETMGDEPGSLLHLYKIGEAENAPEVFKVIRRSIDNILTTFERGGENTREALKSATCTWLQTRITAASCGYDEMTPANILGLSNLVNQPYAYVSTPEEWAIPHIPLTRVKDGANLIDIRYIEPSKNKSLAIDLCRMVVSEPICILLPREGGPRGGRGSSSETPWDFCLKFSLPGYETFYAFIDVSSAAKYTSKYGDLASLYMYENSKEYTRLKVSLEGLPQGQKWVYIYMTMHEVESLFFDDSCVLMCAEETRKFFGPMSGFISLAVEHAVSEERRLQEQAELKRMLAEQNKMQAQQRKATQAPAGTGTTNETQKIMRTVKKREEDSAAREVLPSIDEQDTYEEDWSDGEGHYIDPR